MKKLMIILICMMIPMAFASCSAQTVSDDNAISNTSDIITENDAVKNDTTKSKDANVTTEEPYNDGSDITKVILSYLGQKSESTYDEDAQILLNEIKSCKDKPDALMTDKIGEILVEYKNGDEAVAYATLYIGSDHNLYAKYITEKQNVYAYKIDIDKLNH